jgi:hypothetical protein
MGKIPSLALLTFLGSFPQPAEKKNTDKQTNKAFNTSSFKGNSLHFLIE